MSSETETIRVLAADDQAVLVALAAAFVPVRRAAKIDPVIALRKRRLNTILLQHLNLFAEVYANRAGAL